MHSNKDQSYRAIERTARTVRETHPEHGELSDGALLERLHAAHLTDRSGREPRISLGLNSELALPPDVRDAIAELIGPRGYRSTGITALPIDRPLTERQFSEVKDYFNLSYENTGVVELARVEKIFPGHRFYHTTSGLTHAIQKEFGWFSPEDVAFVATDICKMRDFLEIDPGFFVGTDPTWVAGYSIPAPDNRPSDLLSVLKVPLEHPEIRRLMKTSVFLEVDLSTYRDQLPSTDCFVVRQTDINRASPVFEVIAPIAPMASSVRATFDWNTRSA